MHAQDASAAGDGGFRGTGDGALAQAAFAVQVGGAVDGHGLLHEQLPGGGFHGVVGTLRAGDHARGGVLAVGGAGDVYRFADGHIAGFAAVVGLVDGGGDGVFLRGAQVQHRAIALGNGVHGVPGLTEQAADGAGSRRVNLGGLNGANGVSQGDFRPGLHGHVADHAPKGRRNAHRVPGHHRAVKGDLRPGAQGRQQQPRGQKGKELVNSHGFFPP